MSEEEKKRTLPALERLAMIDVVSAVFVFNEENEILARHMPDHYTDTSLVQVADRIQKVLSHKNDLGQDIKEAVFHYENYALLLKYFSDRYFMAVFFDRDAEVEYLRQPVNLAVLNMEKAVQRVEEDIVEEAAKTDLAEAARRAEKEIYRATGDDSNGYLARLQILATFYIGAAGIEILEQGFREFDVTLPLTREEDMLKITRRAAGFIANPEMKEGFITASENLIFRLELEK
ncbi:MAG: hypothetical protein AAF984_03070 [Verrucomicrobiota bacterium]